MEIMVINIALTVLGLFFIVWLAGLMYYVYILVKQEVAENAEEIYRDENKQTILTRRELIKQRNEIDRKLATLDE